MTSTIFAIAHIGSHSLYVGTTDQLKSRWQLIENQLNQGNYPHTSIQQAWDQAGQDCRFTFRTAQDIATNPDLLGLHQFVDDLCDTSPTAQAS